jgi:hypothetical protein
MRTGPTFGRFLATAIRASVLAIAALTFGCDDRPPSTPTPPIVPTPPPASPVTPSVTAISPVIGSTARPVSVTIRGSGFVAGATVTLDSTAATNVIVVTSTMLTATAPAHDAGSVDVVVTNPGGLSGRLTGAFTYIVQAYTLTASTDTVVAGGQLSVSWTANPAGSWDWVGLFKIGDPSTNYDDWWWEYTGGTASGTLSVVAPSVPGQYEFRYLLDDGYDDTVRSKPVTVTPK